MISIGKQLRQFSVKPLQFISIRLVSGTKIQSTLRNVFSIQSPLHSLYRILADAYSLISSVYRRRELGNSLLLLHDYIPYGIRELTIIDPV